MGLAAVSPKIRLNPHSVAHSLHRSSFDSFMKAQISPSMHSVEIPPHKANQLNLHGAFDFHSAPRLQAILRVKLHERHPLLILDCTGLNFLDSHGIAALVEYALDAKAFDGRIALVGLKPSLREIFHMVNLDEHLRVFDCIDAAQAALLQKVCAGAAN
jgi:stage II sporulation protein AA (anti-sigma F factor antagonist)